MKKVIVFLAASLLLAGCGEKLKTPAPQTAGQVTTYAYPVNNPFAATIVGVPPELQRKYTDVPPTSDKTLTVFPERKVPEGFWYNKSLRYGELAQKNAAPLIFVIAGTGSDYRSATMRNLGEVFYTAGYHVVLLPSTTHTNFIVAASESHIPGPPAQTAKDLYRVLRLIDRDIASRVSVTGRFLTGYSLGAMDAAFTSVLDEKEKQLNFQRVLLINPPVSLYNSIKIIDELLYSDLPGGLDGVDKFIDTEMARLSAFSVSGDALDFQNARMVMEAWTKYPPGDRRLATMIGLTFRLFAANMMFTSDVMAKTGYIFPRNVEFRTTTPLDQYFSVALHTNLSSYFEDVYEKKFLEGDKSLTRAQLVVQSSLESIAPYLSQSPKIGLITNKDDILLAPGEVDRLAQIFGSRAKIYPNGGHLGNLNYAPVTDSIVNFMKTGEMR